MIYEKIIEVDGKEVELEIHYSTYPGEKMTESYPGHPPYLEIDEIYTSNGEIFNLSREQEEELKNEIISWLKDQEPDYYEYD